MEKATLREIIHMLGDKDYKQINFRYFDDTEYGTIDYFWGCCEYIDGKLIPIDGDSYSLDDKFRYWEERYVKGGYVLTVWG